MLSARFQFKRREKRPSAEAQIITSPVNFAPFIAKTIFGYQQITEPTTKLFPLSADCGRLQLLPQQLAAPFNGVASGRPAESGIKVARGSSTSSTNGTSFKAKKASPLSKGGQRKQGHFHVNTRQQQKGEVDAQHLLISSFS